MHMCHATEVAVAAQRCCKLQPSTPAAAAAGLHALHTRTADAHAASPDWLPMLRCQPVCSPPPPASGAYPRQYYYDRLARTAFWTALFAFIVMAAHLGCLAAMMWSHKQVGPHLCQCRSDLCTSACAGLVPAAAAVLLPAFAHHDRPPSFNHSPTPASPSPFLQIPDVMWFPRIELAVCLAILPALAFGAAGAQCWGAQRSWCLPAALHPGSCHQRLKKGPRVLPNPHQLSPPALLACLLPAHLLQACSSAAPATLCWGPSSCCSCPSPSWRQASCCSTDGSSTHSSTGGGPSLCCSVTRWRPPLRHTRQRPRHAAATLRHWRRRR